jgi:hypothetical protein
MEIPVYSPYPKDPFAEGKHLVTITRVWEGVSERKGVAYFSCDFENDHGRVNTRFFPQGRGMNMVIKLFMAAGVTIRQGSVLRTEELVGRSLFIQVARDTFYDARLRQMRTYYLPVDYEPAGLAHNN